MDEPHAVDAVLLDIDGTLLVESSDHLSALVSVLADRLGRTIRWEMRGERPHLDGIDMSGYVDAQVVRALLPQPLDDAALRDVITEYEARFADGISTGRLSSGRAVAGASRTLDTLTARGLGLALCTGNSVEVAREKLRAHGFDRHFTFQRRRGFGDGHADRRAVVAAAIAALGAAPRRTMLVGDSACDMDAAAAAGVTAVGVLTGAADEAELTKAGARFVIPSVRELPALLQLDG